MEKKAYQNIIDNVDTPIFIVDSRGLFRYLNRAAAGSLGNSPEEIVGSHMNDLFPESVAEHQIDRIRESIREKKTIRSVSSSMIRGERRWFETHISPFIEDGGKVDSAISMSIDITDRIEAERNQKESELRFRRLMRSMDDLVWYSRSDGSEMLYISPSVEEIYGYSEDEFIADPDLWEDSVLEEDRPILEKSKKELNETGYSEVEYRIRSTDGKIKWLHDRKYWVEDDSGEIIAIGGIASDISREKEDEKKKLNDIASMTRKSVVDAMDLGIVTIDMEGTITSVNPEMERLLKIKKEDIVSSKASEVIPTYVRRDEIEKAMGIVGTAIERREEMESSTVLLSSEEDEIPASLTVTFSRNEDGDPISVIISFNDVSEVVEIQENLAELKERYYLATEAANTGVWDWDIIKNEVWFSDEWKRMIGYDPDELENRFSTWEDLLHPEDKERMLKAVNDFLASPDGKFEHEFRMKAKDGSYRWIFNRASSKLDGNGKPIRMFGSHLDVTERKENEMKLEKRHVQFLSLLENFPEILYVTDPETYEVIFVNRHFRDLLGEVPVGKKCYEVFQGFDEPCEFCTNGILKKTGEPYTWEYHNPMLDIDFLITDQLIDWPDGRRVRFEFAMDVTKEKKAKKEMEIRQKHLTSLVENPAGYLVYRTRLDRDTGEIEVIQVSPSFAELLGLSNEDQYDFRKWFTNIHPDDLPALMKANEEGMKPPFELDIEVRYDHPELGLKWFELRANGVPYEDDPNTIEYANGIILDITDRKRAEEELREANDILRAREQQLKAKEQQLEANNQQLKASEQQLQAFNQQLEAANGQLLESERRFKRLTENAKDMIYRMSLPDGEYQYVSPASDLVFGYSPEDFYSKKGLIRDVIHPESREYLEIKWNELINGKVDDYYEYRIIDREGKERWINQRNVLVKDEDGNPVAIEGIVTDLTYVKEAERNLRESENRLKLSLEANHATVFEDDLVSGKMTITPELFLHLGYDEHNLPGTIEEFVALVHPDDLPSLNGKVQEMAEGKKTDYFAEYRIKDSEGKWRWIDGIGKVVRKDENGRGVILVGISRDIDDRKRRDADLEKALFDLNERMKETSCLYEISEMLNSFEQDIDFERIAGRIPGGFQDPENTHCMIEYQGNEYSSKGFEKEGWEISETTNIRDSLPLTIKIKLNKKETDFDAFLKQERKLIKAIADLLRSEIEGQLIRQDLEASEERFRLGFETDVIGKVIGTLDNRLLDTNDSFCEIIGASREDLLNSSWMDFFPEEEIDKQMPLVRELVEGDQKSYDIESKMKRGDGSLIDVRMSVSLLRNRDGTPLDFYGSVIDITSRKRFEKELKGLVDKLSDSNRELEQFAYVVSHDLQAPLRKVKSFAELLAKRYGDQLDPKAKNYISHITGGSERMQTLINDLLKYSRVSTKGKPFERVDMSSVVKNTLENLSLLIEESGAMVDVDDLPLVEVDETQMAQLLQNLIGNALKFTGERKPEIHVTCRDKEKMWQFSVRDNGIGIPETDRERIFEIFQRLHSREEYEGTGIGLAICKRIVERHGGMMRVESQPGNGSEFIFTIPKRGDDE